MPALNVKAGAEALLYEIELVTAVLRDKGSKRFSKAFVTAGALVLGAYVLVYAPPQKKLARLEKDIAAAKALSKFGEQYQLLRTELAAAYAKMPAMKDREQWLSNAVVDSLKAENLTPESFSPMRETEAQTLIFQVATVGMPLRFADLYSWFLRMESARPLMHVQSLSLTKRPEPIGLNSVTCEVATVIPKRRFE